MHQNIFYKNPKGTTLHKMSNALSNTKEPNTWVIARKKKTHIPCVYDVKRNNLLQRSKPHLLMTVLHVSMFVLSFIDFKNPYTILFSFYTCIFRIYNIWLFFFSIYNMAATCLKITILTFKLIYFFIFWVTYDQLNNNRKIRAYD